MTIDTTKLRELAQKATPQNFETAQIKTGNDASIECPFCGGEGLIASEGGYCNYDGVAIGVEFYGVGTEFGAAEAYYRAANPATVLALLDEIKNSRAVLKSYGKVLVEISESLDIAPFHFTAPVAVERCKRLIAIEKAARNLAKVKGRHNSELAMNQLLEALK